jgi:hypothetical protein
LESGEITELDDGQANGGGTINTNLITAQPTWPTETDILFMAGTNNVKLSLQRPLLQAIFHAAFDNVRCALLFGYAFPDAIAIPKMVLRSIVGAAEANTFVNGCHNTLAAAVHQRLLSDDEYQAKMIRLVSIILHYGLHI